MLQHVGAKGWVDLLPAAQMCSRFMQEVAVAGREQVLHEDDGRADGDQQEQLARPLLVVILRALWRSKGGSGTNREKKRGPQLYFPN